MAKKVTKAVESANKTALMARLMAVGSQEATTLEDSLFFAQREMIPTDIPIINIAFSGDLDGGFLTGLTVLAGESKSFKTLLALLCLKAYFKRFPDAIGVLYDSEFGTTPKYLKAFGIDPARIIHIPLEHVEQLKFDCVKRLEAIKRGDHVFFMVDSLGNLASKKEVEDAADEKSVTDMTRAKAIRSFLRIVTPHITMKDLPFFIVNHVYMTQEMFSKTVIPGGTAVTYTPNQIFVITKAQEKEQGNLAGYKFTINIHKSRTVREKAKFPFIVTYERGMSKYSGLLEIAEESGLVTKPKQGRYHRPGIDAPDKNWTSDETDASEFWDPLFKSTVFKEFIKSSYMLGDIAMIQEDQEEATVA